MLVLRVACHIYALAPARSATLLNMSTLVRVRELFRVLLPRLSVDSAELVSLRSRRCLRLAIAPTFLRTRRRRRPARVGCRFAPRG